MLNSCFRGRSVLLQEHLDRVVAAVETDLDVFLPAGGNVAADEIGADRQLPVAAVDEHRKLDVLGPAVVHHGIHGGPDGSAGEQDVIHQDDPFSLGAEGDFGLAHRQVGGLGLDVVPVEGYVHGTDRDLHAFDLFQARGKLPGQVDPAGPDPHQDKVGYALVPLQDFVGDAGQSSLDADAIQDDSSFSAHAGSPLVCMMVTSSLRKQGAKKASPLHGGKAPGYSNDLDCCVPPPLLTSLGYLLKGRSLKFF